jgi:phosphoribosylformylglycinamidine synthase PurS subunit
MPILARITKKARIFLVNVVISNKPAARDPEGETIHRDLISKSGFNQIKSIRAGKILMLRVEADDADEAKKLVTKMCNELRIFNPAAHSCKVNVEVTHG